MSGRAFQRIPYVVQVEFRTASSFLVTYSVNLSRGGIFLETDHSAEVGSLINLQFTVPGTGPINLVGRVTWRRSPEQLEDGPPGLGIEFQNMDAELGSVIDRLVTGYQGLKVLLFASQQQERDLLARLVRAVMSTAEVTAVADAREAEALLPQSVDIAVIDTDKSSEEALRIVRRAKSNMPSIPVLAMASSLKGRARAQDAGADEIASNPPQFHEFRARLVRAISRPLSVR